MPPRGAKVTASTGPKRRFRFKNWSHQSDSNRRPAVYEILCDRHGCASLKVTAWTLVGTDGTSHGARRGAKWWGSPTFLRLRERAACRVAATVQCTMTNPPGTVPEGSVVSVALIRSGPSRSPVAVATGTRWKCPCAGRPRSRRWRSLADRAPTPPPRSGTGRCRRAFRPLPRPRRR